MIDRVWVIESYQYKYLLMLENAHFSSPIVSALTKNFFSPHFLFLFTFFLFLLCQHTVYTNCPLSISLLFFVDHQGARQSEGDAVREVQHCLVTQRLLLLKH